MLKLGTLFPAEYYGYVFIVTMNALHLDLLQLVPTDWADYRTEYNIIAANYNTVRYFVAPSKPCKWSGVLAQTIHLTADQDVYVTMHVLSDFRSISQWTNSNITIMISSFSYFMGTINCYTLHAIFNFISGHKLNISDYCMACCYTIRHIKLLIAYIVKAVSWVQFYSQNPLILLASHVD